MDIIQGKNFRYKNTCVTIGKFDGIHIGHRKILDTVIEVSRRNGYKSTVFTFDFSYFNMDNELRLNSREDKRRILKEYGIELLIDYPFDEETRNESPIEFTKNVLVNKLGIKAIVVGDNFRFGKNAEGNTDLLNALGEKYGFRVYNLSLVKYKDIMVSSTRIREEIQAGHIKEANEMLDNK